MKTKEQVLAMKSLTASQKERAQAYFDAQGRFHKPLTMPCNNEKEVVEFIDALQKRYEKRKAAEAKRKEKKVNEQAEVKKVIAVVKEAKAYGFTLDDVIAAVESIIKDKKNAKILAQIEELKAKLV